MRGQQFFLEPADGENFAAESDFAGHGEIAPHRNLAERARNRRGNGDAGRRTIFRDGAFGYVHMQIEGAIKITGEAEAVRS